MRRARAHAPRASVWIHLHFTSCKPCIHMRTAHGVGDARRLWLASTQHGHYSEPPKVGPFGGPRHEINEKRPRVAFFRRYTRSEYEYSECL